MQAEPPDLVRYGLIPELVGRFPLVVSTQGLDLEQMVEVRDGVPQDTAVIDFFSESGTCVDTTH